MAQYILKIEKLDILVNNAGFGNIKEFLDWDWNEIAPNWMTTEELVKLSLENVKSRHVL